MKVNNKEDVIKKIKKLQEEYDYWFEAFRREKDPKKKEEAKQKYKLAISENIRLQEEYDVRVVPERSSAKRARMDIDHKKKKLELSKEQVFDRNLQIEFSGEKERAEKDIRKKINKQGDIYIESVIREMKERDLDTSAIEEILRDLKPDALLSKFERKLKRNTLSTILPHQFVAIYSGEVYIKDFNSKESLAFHTLREKNLEKAEEIIQDAIASYDKAACFSKFLSGDLYFKEEKKKRISAWEATKQKILREENHLLRQVKIKEIIKEKVKSNLGILQTELYKVIEGYMQNEISEAAYYMNMEGILRREKKGNTYMLFIE